MASHMITSKKRVSSFNWPQQYQKAYSSCMGHSRPMRKTPKWKSLSNSRYRMSSAQAAQTMQQRMTESPVSTFNWQIKRLQLVSALLKFTFKRASIISPSIRKLPLASNLGCDDMYNGTSCNICKKSDLYW